MEDDGKIILIETIIETEIHRTVRHRRPPILLLNAIALSGLSLFLGLIAHTPNGFVVFVGWSLLVLTILSIAKYWQAFKGVSAEESLKHESLGSSLILIGMSICYLILLVLTK